MICENNNFKKLFIQKIVLLLFGASTLKWRDTHTIVKMKTRWVVGSICNVCKAFSYKILKE